MKAITAKVWILSAVALSMLAVAILSWQVAAAGITVVAGNTSAGENQPGWYFSRDLTTYTPYTFTNVERTFGSGSLYAGPITNTNSGNFTYDIPDNSPANDMFVAEYFPETLPVAEFQSFSYDMKIGSGGDASKANLFGLSIYATIDDSDYDYDCRYDYVVENGSTEYFLKQVIMSGSSATNVEQNGDRITFCPSVLSAMPAGSYVRVFTITMGDLTLDDTGLDGYFDNVELIAWGEATTFDFENGPQTKSDCQGKDWELYGFRNQGQCIKYVDKGIDTR